MAKRIPFSERPALIRTPDDWARDWGWLSPKKAENRTRELRELADAIEGALDDEGAAEWAKIIRRIADQIDPAKNAASYRRSKARKVAAMREP